MRYVEGNGNRVPRISCGGVSLWMRTNIDDGRGHPINICPRCAPKS